MANEYQFVWKRKGNGVMLKLVPTTTEAAAHMKTVSENFNLTMSMQTYSRSQLSYGFSSGIFSGPFGWAEMRGVGGHQHLISLVDNEDKGFKVPPLPIDLSFLAP